MHPYGIIFFISILVAVDVSLKNVFSVNSAPTKHLGRTDCDSLGMITIEQKTWSEVDMSVKPIFYIKFRNLKRTISISLGRETK